jgi:uncharacterized YigZ family protein
MSDSEIYTVSRSYSHSVRIKRSRFIGTLLPADSRESAEEAVARLRESYHDATHNCYAYKIDDQQCRYSDDGEPSGTAGKPILSMLEKYQLWRVILVVTRYFGGVKLGTGGLIRAYSQCAEETIENSRPEKLVRYQHYRLDYPYTLSRNIQYLFTKYDGIVDDSRFTDAISASIRVPLMQAEAFAAEVQSLSHDQVVLKADNENPIF